MKHFGENPRQPNELEGSSVESTLAWGSKLAGNLKDSFEQVNTMIELAQKDKGVELNLSNTPFDKFQPRGEYEMLMLQMIQDMGKIKTAMYEQGLQVTEEDLKQHQSNAEAGR